jgi:ribonuclease P protein subunit RPR2
MKRRQKEEANEIARERIEKLFRMAEEAAIAGDLESASRYIEMLWNIKLKFRIRLTKEQKRLFCKKCLTFLVDGKSGRYRTEDKNLVITCLRCGNVTRIPLKD